MASAGLDAQFQRDDWMIFLRLNPFLREYKHPPSTGLSNGIVVKMNILYYYQLLLLSCTVTQQEQVTFPL